MPREYHDAANALLRSIPDYQRLSFLELGCGDGRMIERLQDEGARVRGTTYRRRADDYIRNRDYPVGLEVDDGIDLNRPLPYESGTFDVVFSTEVIEHMEGHRLFVAESARVLKSGGWFMLTTPNLHRLASRLHFAITGLHLVRSRMPHAGTPLDRMEEYHPRCVDFILLHWLLWQCGFRIDSLAPSYIHPLSRCLMVLMPVVRMLTRNALNHYGRPEAAEQDARDDLVKWMNSRVLMTSEHLCLLARKSGDPVLTSSLRPERGGGRQVANR